MRDAPIHRPVTIPNLAKVLDSKPYHLMAKLIKIGVFPAPNEAIDDLIAIELAASIGIRLIIIGNDDDDDGFTPRPLPTKPTPPVNDFRSTKYEPNKPRHSNPHQPPC
jgi:hypothetical protein